MNTIWQVNQTWIFEIADSRSCTSKFSKLMTVEKMDLCSFFGVEKDTRKNSFSWEVYSWHSQLGENWSVRHRLVSSKTWKIPKLLSNWKSVDYRTFSAQSVWTHVTSRRIKLKIWWIMKLKIFLKNSRKRKGPANGQMRSNRNIQNLAVLSNWHCQSSAQKIKEEALKCKWPIESWNWVKRAQDGGFWLWVMSQ